MVIQYPIWFKSAIRWSQNLTKCTNNHLWNSFEPSLSKWLIMLNSYTSVKIKSLGRIILHCTYMYIKENLNTLNSLQWLSRDMGKSFKSDIMPVFVHVTVMYIILNTYLCNQRQSQNLIKTQKIIYICWTVTKVNRKMLFNCQVPAAYKKKRKIWN